MPTKPKSVTIDLTPKQQEKLRKLTGQDHTELRVEVTKGTKRPSAKAALSAKSAPADKFGRQGGGYLPPQV